jgi:hypothetical protein
MAGGRADKPAERWPVESITIGPRKRPIDDGTVAALMKSFVQFGQLHPITVRIGDARNGNDGEFRSIDEEVSGDVVKNVPILVSGRQRLEAMKVLGIETAPVKVLECDEATARMFEISENLDRAELTAMERAAQIGEWVRLCVEKNKKKGGQVAQPGGSQPNDQGISAASRELGLERTEVRRAVKIDSMTPEAKKATAEAAP